MGKLVLKNVSKIYSNNVQAVSDFNAEIADGEFIVIVGPSGCGKSTLLRMIVGLEEITSGEIWLDDVLLNNLAPADRDIAMVFQNYALYHTMTSYDNIGISLKLKHKDPYYIHEDIMKVSESLDLLEYLNRLPGQLSGGQRQRVALGRAIIRKPKMYLMDEPLSNLDVKLRVKTRTEIVKLQKALQTTTIYVTHDQIEAMTMADRIIVMDGGVIQQIGTPEDIYNEPVNAFVADFIGESNIVDGIMIEDGVVEIFGKKFACLDAGFDPMEPVDVVIRPEDVDIVDIKDGMLTGTVTNVTFKGVHYDVIVDFKGFKWLIQTTDYCPVNSRIGIKIDPDGIHVMHKSQYSGMFGDYSSYSAEYEEISDAELEPEETVSEDKLYEA